MSTPPAARRRRWRWRYLVVPLLTAVAAAAGLEAVARHLHLDRAQVSFIALERGNVEQLDAWARSGEDLGVAWLPRGFELDAHGFTTAWGRCDFGHEGRTLLVLGDSTTRMGTEDPARGGPVDPVSNTWPALLAPSLPRDVQVCVFAELGYHPMDLAGFAEAMQRRLAPDLTVALLCENDMVGMAPRRLVEQDGRVLAAHLPGRIEVWTPLAGSPLLPRSEALRYLAWRLARATGRRVEVPLAGHGEQSAAQAIQRIDAASSTFRAFYLQPLRDEDPVTPPRLHEVRAVLDFPIVEIDLPQPRSGLRLNPRDDTHMSTAGHRVVAEQIGAALGPLLASPPGG